ncbi:MAG: CGNR zinc finger domain-containing protein [Streptosporangiales bacterium]
MHWVEVEGFQVPVCLGGHPALDFCNTWAGWKELPEPGNEWLKDYATFTVWAQHAGLLTAAGSQRLRARARRNRDGAAQVLAGARRLRTVLHSAVLDPTDESALGAVTGFVRRASAVAALQPGPVPAWQVSDSTDLERPVHATALAARDLLTSPVLPVVRTCPGHGCGWLFIDRSGRRRWCSMSACGNRAKVRAYAERHRNE